LEIFSNTSFLLIRFIKKDIGELTAKYCILKEKDETEPERAGRWAGTKKCGGECGIHTQILK